jgi:hypothetical protein
VNDWNEQLRKIKRTMQEASPADAPAKTKAEPVAPLKPTLHRPNSSKVKHKTTGSKPRWIGPNPAALAAKSAASEAAREIKPQHRDTVLAPQTTKAKPTPKHPVIAPFRPHIKSNLHLSMPQWGDAGKVLMHPECSGGTKARPMLVRIGLDFGTAFTKVAIRAGSNVVLVDWSDVTGEQTESGRYVMPGFVCRDQGEYCWRPVASTAIEGNLKLPVIDSPLSDACPNATLAFLALVIRYARGFLYRHPDIGPTLTKRLLRWELNIGCPTEPHERQEVVDSLRKIAGTAWLLAGAAKLTEASIAAAWKGIDTDTGLETEPGVIPEFVAQIAGYLQSSQAKDGLHALVDVGAATIDVATFNVVRAKPSAPPPTIPIFFSAVKPFGTHYLSLERHAELNLPMAWDDATPIEPGDTFAKNHGLATSVVSSIDAHFKKSVVRCISRVIDGTRTNNRGDPESAAWREGLPIFVTGGGAGCELYRSAIGNAEDEIKKNSTRASFRFIPLDVLGTRVHGVDQEAGVRATVAIGLTEDAESIARVVPHRDIERITHPLRDRDDHTQLYGDG